MSEIWEPRLKNGGSRARLVNGFRFSGIYTAESGRAISSLVNVPSIPFLGSDGAVYNGFGGLRGQGTGGDRNLLPTVVRNGLGGENNFRFDLRIARDFSFSERLKFEELAEGFNIFNHSNYNSFFTTAYNAAATTNATPLSSPVALTPVATFSRPNGSGSQPDGTNARRFSFQPNSGFSARKVLGSGPGRWEYNTNCTKSALCKLPRPTLLQRRKLENLYSRLAPGVRLSMNFALQQDAVWKLCALARFRHCWTAWCSFALRIRRWHVLFIRLLRLDGETPVCWPAEAVARSAAARRDEPNSSHRIKRVATCR